VFIFSERPRVIAKNWGMHAPHSVAILGLHVYVECKNRADLFLTGLANYDKRYKVRGKAVDGWAMTGKHTTEYAADPEIKHIRVEFRAENWWNDTARSAAAGRAS
jgi:hypothetical protein